MFCVLVKLICFSWSRSDGCVGGAKDRFIRESSLFAHSSRVNNFIWNISVNLIHRRASRIAAPKLSRVRYA